MNVNGDPDRVFDDNLRRLGAEVDVPAGPSHEVLSRCDAILDRPSQPMHRRILKMMTKPSVLSASGLAAACLVAAIVLLSPSSAPEVQAAEIMKQLDQQIEQSTLFEMRIENMRDDQWTFNGTVFVSDEAFVADCDMVWEEGSPNVIVRGNATMAVAKSSGWLLLDKLRMEDPQAQAIVEKYFPRGTSTFVRLSGEPLKKLGLHGPIAGPVKALRRGMLNAVKDLVQSGEELGATIEKQKNGTLLLTLPVKNKEAVKAVDRLFFNVISRPCIIMEFEGGTTLVMDQGSIGAETSRITINGATIRDPNVIRAIEAAGAKVTIIEPGTYRCDERHEMFGCTLKVAYDPTTRHIKWFGAEDFGPSKATIIVKVGVGQIDPKLLDGEARFLPDTQTLTPEELQAKFKRIEREIKVLYDL
jgi:hypothetical protein